MLFLVWSAMRLAPRLFGIRAAARDRAGPWHDAAELPVIGQPRLHLEAPDVADAVGVAALLADLDPGRDPGMLADGPHCVCELAAALGARENNVSNHLGRLREAGSCGEPPRANARFLYYERDDAAVAEVRATLLDVLA